MINTKNPEDSLLSFTEEDESVKQKPCGSSAKENHIFFSPAPKRLIEYSFGIFQPACSEKIFLPGIISRNFPTGKVLAYAVLGGIPHYLRQWDPQLSVSQNIKQNILTKGCILYSEVEFLLHQELRETPIYNSIIEAVALGSTKLTPVKEKAKFYYALFSENGFDEKIIANADPDTTQLYPLETIINYK